MYIDTKGNEITQKYTTMKTCSEFQAAVFVQYPNRISNTIETSVLMNCWGLVLANANREDRCTLITATDRI